MFLQQSDFVDKKTAHQAWVAHTDQINQYSFHQINECFLLFNNTYLCFWYSTNNTIETTKTIRNNATQNKFLIKSFFI